MCSKVSSPSEQLILVRCIKGVKVENITTGESERESSDSGKTWSLISSLFHLNETLGFALHHPYETLALRRGVLPSGKKNFLCKRGYPETVTEGRGWKRV
ncbi:CGH_3_HP_G0030960.mRNA.1.CDS.1 [Saccharomyces cerevisiae]|nr:CGH_3_HP_G0030960.mRNA.1.CDS.1 [Saccharomyces cerevisiae]CAI6466935.1 CGH_3_HP_G0030960.mRNA.1.CDS.1 [Saccharomyces cerevisiae]